MDKNGYRLYKRRRPKVGSSTRTIKISVVYEVIIDNKWVVPLCPILSKLFYVNIHDESCSLVKSIKYVCKYIKKEIDQAIFNIWCEDKARQCLYEAQITRQICSNDRYR